MRRTLPRVLVLLVVVILIGYLTYRSGRAIPLKKIEGSLRQIRYPFVLIAIAGTYFTYVVRALRWGRLSRYLPRHTFRAIFPGTLIGFTAVFLLGRAGEPVRPLVIAKKDRVPVSSTFGIYVLERLFDFASPLVMAGTSLLLVPRLAQQGVSGAFLRGARTGGVLLLAGLLGAIAFLVYFRLHGASALERRLEAWRGGAGWRRRLSGLLAGLSDGLQAMRTWGDLAAAIGYSALHWVAVAMIYVCVAHAFGGRLAQISLPEATIVLVFSMVGSIAQIPMVGGGSQFATYVAFTGLFGVQDADALAAAVLIWLCTFAASSLAGVPLLIHEGWSMGELKKMARAEKDAEAAGGHIPDAALDSAKLPRSDGAKR
jgi:uncharacterized protein (TIRG00374 family)